MSTPRSLPRRGHDTRLRSRPAVGAVPGPHGRRAGGRGLPLCRLPGRAGSPSTVGASTARPASWCSGRTPDSTSASPGGPWWVRPAAACRGSSRLGITHSYLILNAFLVRGGPAAGGLEAPVLGSDPAGPRCVADRCLRCGTSGCRRRVRACGRGDVPGLGGPPRHRGVPFEQVPHPTSPRAAGGVTMEEATRRMLASVERRARTSLPARGGPRPGGRCGRALRRLVRPGGPAAHPGGGPAGRVAGLDVRGRAVGRPGQPNGGGAYPGSPRGDHPALRARLAVSGEGLP